jgi:DNA polymerase-3 subunit delta
MAFACYAPTAQDAERLATTIAGENGLRPAPGVARRLVDTTGGDRAVITREIEKLALYLDAAPDRPADLDHHALDAVGADLGDAEMSRAIDAVIEGRVDDLGAELAVLEEAGTSPIPWLRQLVRRLIALADMRGEIDRGDTVDAVMKRHRVFFKEEASTARSLRRWSPVMLATAIQRVRTAERAIMASGNAGGVVAEAAVVALSQAIARRN